MADELSEEDDESSSPKKAPPHRPLPPIDKSKKLSYFDESSDEEDDETLVKRSSPSQAKQVASSDAQSIPQNDLKDLVKAKTNLNQEEPSNNKVEVERTTNESAEDGEEARAKRLAELRAEYQALKRQLEAEPQSEKKKLSLSERRSRGASGEKELDSDNVLKAPVQEPSGGEKLRLATKKGRQRERETYQMAQNFKKKLKGASELQQQTKSEKKQPPNESADVVGVDEEEDDFLSLLDKVGADDWLQHRFNVTDETQFKRAEASSADDRHRRRQSHTKQSRERN